MSSEVATGACLGNVKIVLATHFKHNNDTENDVSIGF